MKATHGHLKLSGFLTISVNRPEKSRTPVHAYALRTDAPNHPFLNFSCPGAATASSSPLSRPTSTFDLASRPLHVASNASEAVPSPPRKDASGAAEPAPDTQEQQPKKKTKISQSPSSSKSSSSPPDPLSSMSDTESENAWQPGVPPILRMTADDEKRANEEGHFFNRLLEAGLVNDSGAISDLGKLRVAPMDATYIHLTINKMLSMNKRYTTVIAVIRDVGMYMGAVNIATAMHRLGRLVRYARVWKPRLPERMVSHPQYQYLLSSAEDVIDEMQPRALANFLWGMAALGDARNTGIVLRISRRLLTINPAELKTQELSNVLWSLATLEVHEPELVNVILDSACTRIDECVPQALSNMIWACATLRHHHPHFPQVVAANAATRLDIFQSQTLANTLWAFSVLGMYPTELFNKAADEIVQRLNMQKENNDDPTAPVEFQGQEISNLLIAYARGCIIHPPLLQALEQELCRTVDIERDGQVVQLERLKTFTSQALANTLWAFATLRWYPARLLPSITEAMGSIVHAMTAQELANSLWAYARFAYHPGRVLASFLSVVEERVNEFEGQGCTNSLWALAVLKGTHSAAFIGLLQRYVTLEKSTTSFGELQYNQVLQAVLLAQFEARGGRVAWRPEVDLPESVVDRALEAWARQQMSTQLSGFHLDVSEALSRLGVPHLLEHLVARDLLSIDIAVIHDGRQLAIEVDGPFHFPVNARTPLGHTMIRRRLLRAAGWIVLPIPWYEWFGMDTWDERLKYLRDALSNADEIFAHQLRPATKELLSTEFSPGPGPGAEAEAELAGQLGDMGGEKKKTDASMPRSFDGLGEIDDGPVLSYYSNTKNGDGALEVATGLMNVLSRTNVQLTPGAVKRLQSMGLERVVREVGERRRANGLSDQNSSGSNNNMYSNNRSASASDVYGYAPPPSLKSSDGDPELLPKPQLPGVVTKMQMLRKPERFTPRFFTEKRDSSWGYFPPKQENLRNNSVNSSSSSSSSSRSNAAAEAPPHSPVVGKKATTKARKNGGKPLAVPKAARDALLQQVMHGKNIPQDGDGPAGDGGGGGAAVEVVSEAEDGDEKPQGEEPEPITTEEI